MPDTVSTTHLSDKDIITLLCEQLHESERRNQMLCMLLETTKQHTKDIERQSIALQEAYLDSEQRSCDLHVILETTVQHADAVENQLVEQNFELQEARLDAEHANELKTNFLSSVTHELRTPLTSMMGFARLIERDLERSILPYVPNNDTKAHGVMLNILQDIAIIRLEGERLMGLINDVLDIAKIESGEVVWDMATLDMRDVVNQAVKRMLGLFEARKLRMDLMEQPALVTGDADRLLQVVVNLIANAKKFSNDGDVICRLYPKSNASGKHWIYCDVEDFGVGIAPEQQERIFDKFHQARISKNVYAAKPSGTGLGLTICSEIIEHHQGTIQLRSTLGEGSCFTFCLPAI